MTENDPVALPELASLLRMTEAEVRAASRGPFAPGEDGRLRLRVALGAAVLLSLMASRALPDVLAAHAAVEAANGAELGGNAALLVAWRGDGKPMFGWFDGPASDPPADPAEGFGSPLRRPMLVVPASEMFTDLAQAVTALRERRAGAVAH